MELFPETAAAAYGSSAAVICLVLYYLRALREAPPGIAWWAAAIAASGVRELTLQVVPSISVGLVQCYAEVLQAAMAVLLLGGTRAFLGRPLSRRHLLAAWALGVIWSLYALLSGQQSWMLALVLTGACSLATAYTGWVFLCSRPLLVASGYSLAGGVFIGWALSWLAEPILEVFGASRAWAAFAGQVLMQAAGMSLVVIVLQRLRISALEAEAKTREAHQRAQSILDATPEATLIGRASRGDLLYANGRAAEQLAADAPTLMTRSLPDFFADPGDYERALERLERQGTVDGVEMRLRTASGKAFWALVSLRPIVYDGLRSVLLTFADISKRKALEEQLLYLATTDSLTGVYSRRHFVELTERELKRARRYQQTVSLLLIDVDHFKQINDTYGHSRGDQVLRQIAAHCRGMLRAHDLLGRLGGEEFAITLPETGLVGAMELAERLRESVAGQELVDPRGRFRATLSIGVAECLPSDDVDSALQRADAALYQAKALGRNRVCCAVGGRLDDVERGSAAAGGLNPVG